MALAAKSAGGRNDCSLTIKYEVLVRISDFCDACFERSFSMVFPSERASLEHLLAK
jgi:hypothetical protein